MITDNIKMIRRKNYMNQTAFAKKIGVTQGTVSQWENGLTRPNSDQLRSISNAFNISVDDLLHGEEIKETDPGSPRTVEAKIISVGVDKLPKDQREQVLAVVRAMFSNHPELFEKGDDE